MDRAALDRAVALLVEQLVTELGASFSALLYGSAARGDWIPGRSDVNLLLMVDDASPEALRRLTPAVTAWHSAGFTPPLLIARDEWRRAADVHPIEITDMRLAHRMLAGPDPLVELTVDDDELRRALERDLRDKLVRLRQAYVRFGDVPRTLGGFATASVAPFLVLLRCTTVLLGREPGSDAAGTVRALADHLGADADAVVEIAAHRRDTEWQCPPGMFARYLEAVRRAILLVDHHQRGER